MHSSCAIKIAYVLTPFLQFTIRFLIHCEPVNFLPSQFRLNVPGCEEKSYPCFKYGHTEKKRIFSHSISKAALNVPLEQSDNMHLHCSCALQGQRMRGLLGASMGNSRSPYFQSFPNSLLKYDHKLLLRPLMFSPSIPTPLLSLLFPLVYFHHSYRNNIMLSE